MYEVKITFEITCDGALFADTTQRYHNMSYDAMQLLQGTINRTLVGMGDDHMTKAPTAALSKTKK